MIREFYERLKANGKPYNIAMVACKRKLLAILNAKIRDRCCRHHPGFIAPFLSLVLQPTS